jgi:DNA repair exonuclease SbcCD ATPase subunit
MKSLYPWEEPLNKMQEACQHFSKLLDPKALDRVQSLVLLSKLADFLENLQACLKRLPTVEEIARPGQTLKETIHSLKAETEKQANVLRALREELKQLAGIEAKWEQQQKEVQALEERLKDLRRLQKLVESDALEKLREQVAYLERQQALLEAGELEQALREKAQSFVRLSEAQLQHLNREAKDLLQQAEAKEQELAITLTRLEEARERYRRAYEAWEQYRKELEKYEEADRRVAQALPESAERRGALEALEQVRALLRAAEEALRIAIENNERMHQRGQFYLGG